MIKIGIVGCGKITDQHVEQIVRIPGTEIVGVCDTEELMTRQLCERYKIRNAYTSVEQMLDDLSLDVIHINAPPQTHQKIGGLCIDAGCHIFFEKPLALNYEEAKNLVDRASEAGVKITVGHKYQFTHVAREMRSLIEDGYLGGPPVHMESTYCYSFGDPAYAKALLGDQHHWARSLPGRLLHNIISHGICKITEFLSDENCDVLATGYTSSFLKNINETDIIDELRVIINDSETTSAYFTFSSQMKPSAHQFTIYGPANGVRIDNDTQSLIKMTGREYKSFLNQFLPPYQMARQYRRNSTGNIRKFLKSDFHYNSGLKFLIESFYRSITHDEPLPFTYKEILLTNLIMDRIFEQIYTDKQENRK
jgi:predicted dehydrogenase